MKKSNKTKKKYLSGFTVVASVACIVLAAFVLCGYISLTELTITDNKKQKELVALTDSNAIIQLEIDRKNSLGNIEQIATEQLNMIKLQSYQIHSVNLESDDSVEIVSTPKSDSLFDGIVASFNILVEYLN